MSEADPGATGDGAPYEGDAAQWRRFARSPLVLVGVVLAVAVPGACLSLNVRGRAWQEESTAYVREVVPAICETWDVQELKRRASPTLLEATPETKLAEYFGVFARRLGALKKISVPTGGAFFNVGTAGLSVYALYEVPSEFQHGKGTVRVRLERTAGTWRIAGFFVNSDVLMP